MFGRQKLRDLTAAEVHAMMAKGEALLIDVREPDEFAAERIHGALNFPLSTFDPKGLPDHAGRTVVFHTAVCLVDTRSGAVNAAIDRTEVVFRPLSADEIARYVERDNPLDAAGGFKAEGAGIALFERIESTDPTALIGLPLILLSRLLRGAGFTLPWQPGA